MVVKGYIHKFWLVFTMYFVLTSIGIPLHEHYCKGNLKLIQFFSEPKTCHSSHLMFHKTNDCCSNKPDIAQPSCDHCSKEKGNCCTNKFELKKLEIQATIEKLDFSNNNETFKLIIIDFTNYDKIVSVNEFIGFKKTDQLFPWKKPGGRYIVNFNQQFIC